MKGQQQALSAILISGILIGVVGSIYFWGLPLIQKNKDISTLDNSEVFIKNVNEKIKYIANNGGRDQIKINLPGIIKFENGAITFDVETQGTIYAIQAEIPLAKNDCSRENGNWGINDPEVICVKSLELDEKKYITKYTLTYIRLDIEGVRSYKIELTGPASMGGSDHSIIIENSGTIVEENLKKIIISISIV